MIRMSANQKLGNAWPSTERPSAKRSSQELGLTAASTPSGSDSDSAKASAQMPSISVIGSRSAISSPTDTFRKKDSPKSPPIAFPTQSPYFTPIGPSSPYP